MKLFALLLILCLAGCKKGGAPFAAPSSSDVTSISALLYNRPDGGEDIERFEVPKSSHQAILETLNGSEQDTEPMKWQVAGHIKITHSLSSTDILLFWTGKGLGAFKANGQYYRSGSDQDFIRLISTAKKQQSGQGSADNPDKLGRPPTTSGK